MYSHKGLPYTGEAFVKTVYCDQLIPMQHLQKPMANDSSLY